MPRPLLALLAAIAASLLLPVPARAGLIIQRPVALGLSNGLVGHWSFDGQDMNATAAFDVSGQGNHGTSSSVLKPASSIGKIGQAMSFNGTTQYIGVADTASLRPGNGDWSISAWIKPPNASVSQEFIHKMQVVSPFRGYGMSVCSSMVDCAANPGRQLMFDYFGTSGNWRQSMTTANFADGNWHHTVMVADKAFDHIRIYVDGVEVAVTYSEGGSWPNITTTDAMNIGRSRDGLLYFGGALDDVRVYNRLLVPDEVKRLYKIGSTLTVNSTRKDTLRDGLVGHWTMDGPSVARTSAGVVTQIDSSGNNLRAVAGSAAASPASAIGRIGQGADFDGSSDALFATAASVGQTTSRTVSAWIYPRGWGGLSLGAIVGRVSGVIEWGFGLDDTDVNDGLTFYQNCTGAMQVFAANSIALNKWQHVVVTWTGGCANTSVTFYVDAVAKTRSGASGSGSPTNDNGLSFEISSDSSDQFFFNGVLDDIRVYNRVLSPDDIKRLYKLGATATINSTRKDTLRDGLVGHWTFDGGDTGTTSALDGSGNNQIGWFVNAPVKSLGKIGQGLDLISAVDPDRAVRMFSCGSVPNAAPITISEWVFPRSIPSPGFILFEGGEGGSLPPYEFYSYADPTGVFVYSSNLSGGDGQSTANVIPTNTWTHVVIVLDTSSTRFYLNGSLVDSKTALGWAGEVTNRCIAGSDLPGILDDVRIYNRPLTADEVKRLYNMGR